MEKRYATLRVISTVFKVLGIIMLVITIILAIGACALYASLGSLMGGLVSNARPEMGGTAGTAGGILGGTIAGLVTLIYGGISSMAIFAFGGLTQVVIDMEENTRAMAMLVHRREAPPAAGSAQR